MRRIIALSLAAFACSGPDDNGPGDGGQATPIDEAHWGLADDTCLHYVDDQGRERYTIEVEKDATTITGFTTWHLTHRLQGITQRSEYLEVKVEAGELVLHRRDTRADALSTQETITRYDPPPVFLRDGVSIGDSVRTTTSARVSGGGRPATETQEHTVSTSPLVEETLTAAGESVSAMKYTISVEAPGGETTIDKLWFAPKVGIVKFDPAGTSVGEMTLASIEKLGAGGTSNYCTTP